MPILTASLDRRQTSYRQSRRSREGDEQHRSPRQPADPLARARAHLALYELLALAHLAVRLDERGNSSHHQVVKRLAFGAAAGFQLVQPIYLAAVPLGEGRS